MCGQHSTLKPDSTAELEVIARNVIDDSQLFNQLQEQSNKVFKV